MAGAIDPEDVSAILSGVFDINATLASIDDNLARIVNWLEDDGEEEEEDDPVGPSP